MYIILRAVIRYKKIIKYQQMNLRFVM